MKILVLNSGSSSQKACLYEIGETLPKHAPACLWEAKVEFSGDTAAIAVKNSPGIVQKETVQVSSREQVVKRLLSTLTTGKAQALTSLSEIDAVGHRVVHGGLHFEEPVPITPEVRSAIASVSGLAPLHIPAALEGIDIIESVLGTFLKWQYSTQDFIGRCPPPLQLIRDLTSGSKTLFAATDSMASIINTVRPAPLNY